MKGQEIKKITLVSGISLYKKSSFFYQLKLLKRCFEELGIQTTLVDSSNILNLISRTFNHPSSSSTFQQEKFLNINKYNGSLNKPYFNNIELITNNKAAILLGYPDQFSFIKNSIWKIPTFLWAQFSKPPAPEQFKKMTPVPLTETTKVFLVNTGVEKIGDIVPHGVDTHIFHPMKQKIKPELKILNIRSNFKIRSIDSISAFKKKYNLKKKFVIGCVANNNLRKRLDRVIESFAFFSSKVENSILLIKTNSIRAEGGFDIETLLSNYGIKSKTRVITEEITTEQMPFLYNSMDVLVIFSEWEGFCIPAIEAMACGIPIITHPIQGPGEIGLCTELMVKKSHLIHENGTVLRWVDTKEACRMLLKACFNPKLLKKISEEGVKVVRNLFDIHTVAKKWIQVIKSKL